MLDNNRYSCYNETMPKRYSRRKVELIIAVLTDTVTEWSLKYGSPVEIVSAAWREAPRHDRVALDKWLDRLTVGILARGWPPLTEWMMFKSLIHHQGARLVWLPGQISDRLHDRLRKTVGRTVQTMSRRNDLANAWRAFHLRLTPTTLS